MDHKIKNEGVNSGGGYRERHKLLNLFKDVIFVQSK